MATPPDDDRTQRYERLEEAIASAISESLPPAPDAPRILLVVLASMLGDFLALVPLEARPGLMADIQRIMLMAVDGPEATTTVQ